jgi:glycerol-3-phosphate dehydrogenase
VWENGWRDRIWASLDGQWDLIIIGGGITGAGILRESARAGLRALLVEAGDFASGTSSRSSKLVHGGFRYLRNAQLKLTLQSVRERERLLREGRGLVTPLGFLLAGFAGDRIPLWLYGLGLGLYDLLALKWGHRRYDPVGMLALCPQLEPHALEGGYRYIDAVTDDARLVLRVLREAVSDGGTAINYARAVDLLRLHTGAVVGVILEDVAGLGTPRHAEVHAAAVINATGAWADELRGRVGGRPCLRHLRGSHLVLPWNRLPLTRAVSFLHPEDQRPVFAFPWEGVTVLGTTDVEHEAPIESDPGISHSEVDYLLSAAARAFAASALGHEDILSTFSGIRAVMDTGQADPSRESREYILRRESGLLTVTGGKLTTFRLMAHAALRAVRSSLPRTPHLDRNWRVLDPPPDHEGFPPELEPDLRLRISGRYGKDAPRVLACGDRVELASIGEGTALWAELRWAARAEGVVHLDDLLLRRVRLGLLQPHGGAALMPRIRAIAQAELGWDDRRWEEEVEGYLTLWRRAYAAPGKGFTIERAENDGLGSGLGDQGNTRQTDR